MALEMVAFVGVEKAPGCDMGNIMKDACKEVRSSPCRQFEDAYSLFKLLGATFLTSLNSLGLEVATRYNAALKICFFCSSLFLDHSLSLDLPFC